MKLRPVTPNAARVDSYKISQYQQNRPGLEYLSSYIETRGVDGKHDWKSVVFFGLGVFLKRYMSEPLCTLENKKRLFDKMRKHGFEPNEEGFNYIVEKYNGFPPVVIQALPEGSVVPLHITLLQVVNKDPKCAWITNYLETMLLRAVWYPSTVCTLSYHIKRKLIHYMNLSCDNLDKLPFMLHDFGARGASSAESAELAGMAHLVNFLGTDTFEALYACEDYYDEVMAGFSIAASEHSTITGWGGEEFEIDAMRNMIEQFGKPNQIFACVSDSYNIFKACEIKWGETLKNEIIKLGENNATLVIRPDSGDPTVIPIEIIRILMDKFGYTVNSKGYKVLPPYVRVIQGDGINEDSITTICENMLAAGFSLDNIAFGMGGALHSMVNRDTLKWAMKASAAYNPSFRDGWYDVFKQPITDTVKVSKKGRRAVISTISFEDNRVGEGYQDIREDELNGRTNLLVDYWDTGELLVDDNFTTVRSRAV